MRTKAQQLMRDLAELRVPHPSLVHDFKCRVEDVNGVGIPNSMQSARTGNNSFSRAVIETDIGDVLVWWSWRTCICKVHLPSGAFVRSVHRYSVSTTRHQSAVRVPVLNHDLTFCYDGDIGGELRRLKPAQVIEQITSNIMETKQKMARARENFVFQRGYLAALLQRLTETSELLDEPYTLPDFRQGLTDKQFAKVVGISLNDVNTACMLRYYDKVKEKSND